MFAKLIAKRCGVIPTLTRSYHSIYHVNPTIVDMKTIENQVLNKAYEKFVPEYGFTNEAVQLASKDLGLNGNSTNAMFNFTSSTKDMQMELILFHLKKCRQELENLQSSEVFKQESKVLNETEKLRSLIHYRLRLNEHVIKHLPKVLGHMIQPSNLTTSMRELHNLSDDITYYAGDRSIDFAWYSKRASISGLFVQCELFMINDKSAGFQDTYKFADARLKEIENAAYAYNSIEEWLFFNAVSVVNLVKSQLARG